MFTRFQKNSDIVPSKKLEALSRSQAIIEFTTDGKIITANENFLQTMGYSLPEIVGRHHSIFVDPVESASDAYATFWAKLREGRFQAAEYRRIGKDAREVWIQASYNPVLNDDGTVAFILKLATDITEQKRRSLEAINRSQAVIHFALDSTILDANENFLKTMGYQIHDIKGKKHAIFVPPEEQGPDYTAFWNDLRRGEFKTAEFRRIDRNGKSVWIQATYNPVFNVLGQITHITKYATDITQRVKERLQREEAYGIIDADLTRIFEAVTNVAGQVTEASAAAEQTAQNVETVAAGSTQLASSVEEISGQVSKASSVSGNAVAKVKEAHASISGLSQAANQIGEIINLIADIAAQTNLLSLNATIEAARAGEAGRGFAVVAGEVKTLANQSAKASDDIARQILEIQEATKHAVATIETISDVIEQVNSISVSISGAVEEQACVTRDISVNMGDATTAVSSISQGMHSIAEATSMIKTSTEYVKSLSSRIAS